MKDILNWGNLKGMEFALTLNLRQLAANQIPETAELKCVEFPHIICHVSDICKMKSNVSFQSQNQN